MNNGAVLQNNNTIGVTVWEGGALSMNDGAVIRKNNGGGVEIDDNGAFTMSGGRISGNFTEWSGGGVSIWEGAFTMTGGEISGNFTEGDGGGVYIRKGAFAMSGGRISGNFTEWFGGGVYVQDGTFAMTGGVIAGNTADRHNMGGYGGGVYVSTDGEFAMSGGEISGNSALSAYNNNSSLGGYGGGVYVQDGTFTMTGGKISGNFAEGTGGGMVVHRSGTFTMTAGEIKNNTSELGVGGIEIGNGICINNAGVFGCAGTITLGGTAVINNNTGVNNGKSNVLLINGYYNTSWGINIPGAYITLGTGDGPGGNGVAAPAPGMWVGVTKTGDGRVFIESGANVNHTQYFFADESGMKVVHENGLLRIDARSENEPVISAGSVSVVRGKTVSVPIVIGNNPGIASMQLTVTYDNRYLTLESVKDGGLLGRNQHGSTYGSPYNLAWENSQLEDNITENGEIALLNFRVVYDAPPEDYAISLSYNYLLDNIIDINGDPVYFGLEHGSVNVISFIYGDVLGVCDSPECELDFHQATILAQWIAGWLDIPDINQQAADVDVDGEVTIRDVMVLERHIAGWPGYETLPIPRYASSRAHASSFSFNVPAINVSSASARVGDIVDVNISLSDNPGIIAMRLGVEFDDSALRLVEVIDNGSLERYHNNIYASPHALLLANGTSSTDFNYSGGIVTLRFEILSETAGTSVTVSYDWAKSEALDIELNRVYFEVNGGIVSTLPANVITPVGAVPTASVKVLNGNKNDLTITVTETYSDGSINKTVKTFSINNNAAGSYQVGRYIVYVDTKGNDQIRQCYIVN